MYKTLVKKHGKTTLYILFLSYIFIFALIISSASRPMWYDEVWRAYLVNSNLHIPIQDNQGLSPLTTGYFLSTKAFTFFIDNNFTNRGVTYLSLIGIPISIYWFCRIYINKKTAQFMVVIGLVSGYILQYSTQNKPNITDILCLLTLLIAFHYYSKEKLNKWYFVFICIFWILFSFASYLVLACLGMVIIARSFKIKSSGEIKRMILPGITLLSSGLFHYIYFIKPQSTENLIKYYRSFYPSGSVFNILKTSLVNFLSIFGVTDISNSNGAQEHYPVFWKYPQIIINNRESALQMPTIYSWLFLILFIVGSLLLWKKNHKRIIFYLITLFSISWFLGIIKLWPYGNARPNTFILFLFLIVTTYGYISILEYSLSKHRLILISIILGLTISILPYKNLYTALRYGVSYTSYSDRNDIGIYGGGEHISKSLAIQSEGNQPIYVDAQIFQYPIRYYYEYSDILSKYRDKMSKNTIYGGKYGQGFNSKELSIIGNSRVVWYINSGIGDEYNIPSFEKLGFSIVSTESNGGIVLRKLIRE